MKYLNPLKLALRREHLTEEDHANILKRMVVGKIASQVCEEEPLDLLAIQQFCLDTLAIVQ